jgi:acetyl-CoA C-acetyltransferase
VQCGRPLLLRQPFSPEAFDQVILGCVNVVADEMNPARIAALRLGMGEEMTAFTVQINCGSGMQSIDTAYPLYPERNVRPDSGRRRRCAQPFATGVPSRRRGLVRRAVLRQGSARQGAGAMGFRPGHFAPEIGLEKGSPIRSSS